MQWFCPCDSCASAGWQAGWNCILVTNTCCHGVIIFYDSLATSSNCASCVNIIEINFQHRWIVAVGCRNLKFTITPSPMIEALSYLYPNNSLSRVTNFPDISDKPDILAIYRMRCCKTHPSVTAQIGTVVQSAVSHGPFLPHMLHGPFLPNMFRRSPRIKQLMGRTLLTSTQSSSSLSRAPRCQVHAQCIPTLLPPTRKRKK